jgi:uncharacterized RDD family membrane protein YckC
VLDDEGKRLFKIIVLSHRINTINWLLIWLLFVGYLRVTDFGIARTWRPDNA